MKDREGGYMRIPWDKHLVCLILLLTGVLVLFTSCSPLELVMIEWEEDGEGFRQFSTNSGSYYGQLCTWEVAGSAASPMTVVEAQVKKMSGSDQAGYGIVFCYTDANNFYVLLISISQRYWVLAVKDGKTEPITFPSVFSDDLDPGYGVVNKVRVSQVSAGHFELYFNDAGTPSATFADSRFSDGSAGFCTFVHVENEEMFPQVPSDTRFRLLQPTEDPPPP